MGMMEGSSLRIMLGTYSAFGTLEDISYGEKKSMQIDFDCTYIQTSLIYMLI